MSDADRSQYTEEVTQFSEQELQRLLDVAAPPVCLLGGWAVHLHVTDAFRAKHGRADIVPVGRVCHSVHKRVPIRADR